MQGKKYVISDIGLGYRGNKYVRPKNKFCEQMFIEPYILFFLYIFGLIFYASTYIYQLKQNNNNFNLNVMITRPGGQ